MKYNMKIYCVASMQLGAPILCIVPQVQLLARYVYYTW